MSINYVVCVYISETERSKLERGLYYHVQKQIDALKSLKIPDIKMATFVVNEGEDLNKAELETLLNSYDGPVPIEVKYRENWGRSYGAWEYQIRETLGEYDYYVLMEDDYIPVKDFFYKPFVDKIKDRVGYVCMWYTNHPAFSIGVISAEMCKDLINKEGEIFINYNLAEKDPFGLSWDGYEGICCDERTRFGGVWQNCYHTHMLSNGWVIEDMLDYSLIFRTPKGAFKRITKGSNYLILPTINNIK